MFVKRITVFKLLGFKVGVDISWLILAVLVTWSLATGLFPHYFEGFSNATYWWMGIGGASGLFASIVFHELCHSIIARRYGLPIKGITLFIFGGVAEMHHEPTSPKAEFMMAIAGPVSSALLGTALYTLHRLGTYADFPQPLNGVLLYLGWLNFILAGFNLIPAFPLDGGRILRSLLWAVKKDFRFATRVAATLGAGFGLFMMIMGILVFVGGNFVAGLWWFLIGMFIRNASKISYLSTTSSDYYQPKQPDG